MIVPIQDIQGLVCNEYINLENAFKIFKNPSGFQSKCWPESASK